MVNVCSPVSVTIFHLKQLNAWIRCLYMFDNIWRVNLKLIRIFGNFLLNEIWYFYTIWQKLRLVFTYSQYSPNFWVGLEIRHHFVFFNNMYFKCWWYIGKSFSMFNFLLYAIINIIYTLYSELISLYSL